MVRDENILYGSRFTSDEVEAVRCLIGNHFYQGNGYPEDGRVCITCGKKEEKE